jgi:hypothetical protein
MKERKKYISHEQLKAAIRKFEASGGIIRKLPEQKSFNSQGVGVRIPVGGTIDPLAQ